MIVDLGPRFENGADAVLIALKIRNQDLDRAARNPLMNLPDRLGEDVGAEIGKIVAVDGRDDRVLKLHLRDRLRDALRLRDIVLRRPAVGDGAIGAVPGADVAQDHESGGAVLPTFADVGAVRLLADGMQVELTHQVLEPHVVGTTGRLDLEPRRLALGQRLGAVTAHDLIEILHRWRLVGRRIRRALAIYIKNGRGEIVTGRG